MKRRINKEWLGNHFRYAAWRYAALVLLATFGWSLIFTITAYRVPPERKVDIIFVGPYAREEAIALLAEEAHAAHPEIESITAQSIPFGFDAEIDFYSQQVLTLRLGAHEGDIFILPRATFFGLVEQGMALPLDEYLASGALMPSGEMATGWVASVDDEYAGQKMQYGIPLDEAYGLMVTEMYDNRNSIMMMPFYTQNPDGAISVMQWILDNRVQPKPPELE